MNVLWMCAALALAGPERYQASYDLEAVGNTVGALAEMDAQASSGDRSYVLHLRRGWLRYLLGEYVASVEAYRAAVKAEPQSVEALQGLLLPLMAQRAWGDARTVCGELLALAPNDYLGRSRLAWVHYSSGRYREAAEAYRQVLVRYPADVEMRAGLGWALLKSGDRTGAQVAFAEVLQVAPSHASAAQGLEALGASE